jgi:hypothetical protein
VTRWAPGAHVLHRFVLCGDVVDARPVTVLADEPEALVLWLADGTRTMVGCLPGGVDLRSVSKQEMFGQRWHSKPHVWRNSVLMVLPPAAAYALWSFFSPGGEFLFWYANLQSPYVRWNGAGGAGGLDIVDHQLDLVVSPAYDVQWKDVDELAAAVAAGWLTEADSAAAHAEAHRLSALASAGAPPFDHSWHASRPEGVMPAPPLPTWWAAPPAGTERQDA